MKNSKLFEGSRAALESGIRQLATGNRSGISALLPGPLPAAGCQLPDIIRALDNDLALMFAFSE